MRRRSIQRWMAFVVLVLASTLVLWAGELKTWTSRAGKTVTAEYKGMSGSTVLLQGESGKDLRIPFAALSEESQAQAKILQAAEPKVTTGAVGAKPGLDVLGTSEQPFFTARFYEPDARMEVSIKEGASPKTDPLPFRIHVYYQNTQTGAWLQRKPVKLLEQPVYQGGKIRYKILMADNVEVEVYYYVHDNQIEMGYFLQDPEGISFPSDHMLRCDVPPLFTLNDETGAYSCTRFPGTFTWAELEPKLAGFELFLKPVRGKPVHHPYSLAVERLESPVKSWQIKGGVYGPRVLSMKAPKSDDGQLNAWIYGGYRPGNGYQLNYKDLKPSSRGAGMKMATFTVK